MPHTSGLTIRQHERETLALRVEFLVADAYRTQVRFSPVSNAAEPHMTRGIAQDISPDPRKTPHSMMEPLTMTAIRSAWRMVLRRWAMMTVVRLPERFLMFSTMVRSDTLSRDAVDSSIEKPCA